MNWLKHPAIKLAYIASVLYNEKDPKKMLSNTSKLRRKVHEIDKQRLTPSELLRLQQIREELIQELNNSLTTKTTTAMTQESKEFLEANCTATKVSDGIVYNNAYTEGFPSIKLFNDGTATLFPSKEKPIRNAVDFPNIEEAIDAFKADLKRK